jgi:hypothetical protein
MALVFSSFNDHLGTLPPELSRHGAALRTQVQQRMNSLPDAGMSAFLFLPDLPDQTDHPDHPDYEDAAQVFVQAVEQMYLPKPCVGDEIPLLFFGYHATSRLRGKRASQGFLLTDQAVYVQDDFTVLLAAPVAQSHVLPGRIDEVPAFVAMLLESYKSWKDWAELSGLAEPMLRERCGALLAPVVGAVVEHHAQHASQRQVPLRTWKLSELVAEHDAAGTLLDPLNPKLSKKLGKVSAKFQVPAGETLQFALVDFPLFGGPYGLALTAQALYGKNLMDAPVRIALQGVDAGALQITAKGDELLAGSHEPVALPAYMDAALREPFLAFLKQEIASLQSQA